MAGYGRQSRGILVIWRSRRGERGVDVQPVTLPFRGPAHHIELTVTSGDDEMQFTLTGFRHDSGLRVFQFQGIAAGKTRSDFFISADLTLIRTYGIRIQELPLLCLRVLEQREFAEQ